MVNFKRVTAGEFRVSIRGKCGAEAQFGGVRLGRSITRLTDVVMCHLFIILQEHSSLAASIEALFG